MTKNSPPLRVVDTESSVSPRTLTKEQQILLDLALECGCHQVDFFLKRWLAGYGDESFEQLMARELPQVYKLFDLFRDLEAQLGVIRDIDPTGLLNDHIRARSEEVMRKFYGDHGHGDTTDN